MEEFQVADISQAAASSSQMLIYYFWSDTESFFFFFFPLLLLPPDLEMRCWKVSVKFLIWKDQELIANW